MAKYSKRTRVVGGFDTLKAAQRAKKDASTSRESVEQEQVSGPRKIATRIDHTALPTRHEIMCYECGLEFQLTGRSPTTHCPKCRKMLEIKDYTIEDEWQETIKTAGKIYIASNAVLKSGDLMATDIVVDGHIEGGTLQAYRWLELTAAATFLEKAILGRSLRIGTGAKVALKRKATFRNVEVHGILKAKLRVEGCVVIKATGCLQGEVHGAHIHVEEGGGLLGKVDIEPVEQKVDPEPS